MKKFKDLNYTYERLKSEVSGLTNMCIKETAALNSVTTKLKETKEEYELLKSLIISDTHKNKVDINNYNRDFISKLEERDKKLQELDIKLKKEKSIQKELATSLDKRQIGLQVLEKELNTTERGLTSKSSKLDLIQRNLDKKTSEMVIKSKNWEKEMKEKKEKLKELDKTLINTRNEIEVTHQINLVELEKIDKQNMILKLREDRLRDKELKINSDMKTLLSAKKHTNG